MSKKMLLIPALLFISIAGYYFFAQTRDTVAPTTNGNIPSPITTESLTRPTELPKPTTPPDWITYTSSDLGFTIKHPKEVKVTKREDGIHFLQLGPTQSQGTELYDGLSILVSSPNLGNQSFEDLVRAEYQKSKDEPVISRITELNPLTINGTNGYMFEVEGIGVATLIYLEKSANQYITITNSTVEPQNSKSNFVEKAKLIVSSIETLK